MTLKMFAGVTLYTVTPAITGDRAKIEILVIARACRVRFNIDIVFISDSLIKKYFEFIEPVQSRSGRLPQYLQQNLSTGPGRGFGTDDFR